MYALQVVSIFKALNDTTLEIVLFIKKIFFFCSKVQFAEFESTVAHICFPTMLKLLSVRIEDNVRKGDQIVRIFAFWAFFLHFSENFISSSKIWATYLQKKNY
jgi:hypothetical protein